jgi:formylglycine-generating enzyme required for sulfatase activity
MIIETFGKIYFPIKNITKILFLYMLVVFPVAQNVNAEQHLNFTLPDMIDIPAGEFEMGCVSTIDCKPREKPVHKVIVPAFQMAKTEVTAELWAACVKAKGCSHEPENNGWTELGMPVRYVSWDDVQVFITWLNSATGDHYRLPSEAEWEYAARAGTETPFNTGMCITDQQANFEGNAFKAAGCSQEGKNRKRVVAVASFSANAFGLHDMHGNVWEWTDDCWHQNYDDAPTDGSVWSGSASECERHTMRGGTWHGAVDYMRSAYRFRYPREIRTGGLGFRLARSYSK